MNKIVIASFLVAVFGVVWFQTQSVLEPVLWETPNKLGSFTGPTAVNDILKHGVKITGNFSGPESIAFDPSTGIAYASFNDGTVGSFSESGVFLGRVFFVGGFLLTPENTRTNGVTKDTESFLHWCIEEATSGRLAWNEDNEYKCGRPLGIRFRVIDTVPHLFFVDSRHGIFQLNLDTNHGGQLLTEHDTITPPSSRPFDAAITLPIRFFNDLDLTEDNTVIYFSDSSYKHTRTANRQEVLDGAPRGRIFQFDLATGLLTVPLCGLHFPNGVQLLHTKGGRGNLKDVELIVAELTRFRLVRINLSHARVQEGEYVFSCEEKGSLAKAIDDAGKNQLSIPPVSIFSDSLPGIPDNVRVDSTHKDRQGRPYYLIGFGSNSVGPISPLWLGYQLLTVRDFVGKFVPMELVEKLVPRYGLGVVVNQEGKMVNSVHDASGMNAMVSEFDVHPGTGDLWAGSHSEPCIVIVPKRFLPANWE